jgi:hypothetical protein
LLREIFGTIQQIKEIHSTRIIAMLCGREGSGIADVPPEELPREELPLLLDSGLSKNELESQVTRLFPKSSFQT